MKSVKFILGGCIAIVFMACSPTIRLVSIETLTPAEYEVNYSNKTLAIFNALHVEREDEDGNYTYANDSLMTALLAESMKDVLEQSIIFSEYDIPVYNLTLFDHDTLSDLYDKDYLQSLSDQTQAGMLLFIDNAETNMARQENRFSDNAIAIKWKANYRFYDVEKQQYDIIPVLDSTLFLYSSAMVLSEDNLQSLWHDFILEEGRRLAATTVPRWTSERRFYFVPPSATEDRWKDAADYADRSDWTSAMRLWGELVGEQEGKMAAYAAFNMALGAEMMNEYTLALEWLALADKNAVLEETELYRKLIRDRISEAKIIDQQLAFSDE
jgi:hypothetical protein